MKKILIIYPHFPPSNLAGVHRPRLFAQHLPSFGWEPIILTVHEKYYEETLDTNLKNLLPVSLRIEKVNAFGVTKPRVIGDIGLRAFFQLYIKAKHLILAEEIDFLLIPIPSFYCALLGRWLHHSTRIKYGVDYIDPWVHQFPGSNKLLSRHWLSTKIAQFLEPIAVKNASLITGVAEGYYKGVQERNPHLLNQAVFGAMPYGGEKQDHLMVHQLQLKPYLFLKKEGVVQLVYAGAMLPKAYSILEKIFESISSNPNIFKNIEFHFIGTGKLSNDAASYNIKPLAQQYSLWQKCVFEYPKRIPYLDVLVHLNIADGIFILGSTEPHYTPSKTYQAVLSGKPVFAVLHEKSSAVLIIKHAKVGLVLSFNGISGLPTITENFISVFKNYISFIDDYDEELIDLNLFDQYSANSITKKMANFLNIAMKY